MSKKGGSSAPPTPDPNVVSQAQTTSNKDTAAYNAALGSGNIYTPLGSSTYTQRTDPTTGAPVFDQTVTLSPEQQKLYQQQLGQNLQLGDISQGMMNQVQSAYGAPMDTSGLPQLRTGNLSTQINAGNLPDVPSGGLRTNVGASGLPNLPGSDNLMGARDQAQQALYGRQTAFLDPQFQKSEEQMRTRLLNQGVSQDSEAFKSAMDDFARQKEFAYGQARDSSIAGATGELSNLNNIASNNRAQLYGEALSGANFENAATATNADLASRARGQLFDEASQQAQFGNAAEATNTDLANRARSQGMSELFSLRSQPLNEFNALRGAAPVDIPNFQQNGQPTVAPTDVAGNIWNAYQGNLNVYNANQASQNGLLGGLFNLGGSLGGAAIMKSDRRVKWAVKQIGVTALGLPAYAFRYVGSHLWHVGVMAQDVLRVRPAAVVDRDGVLHVDFGALA